MTNRDDREQQQAELLWKYIEELRKAENPGEVQFVAITNGEGAELVGLMETAAEACVAARAAAAPNCRREAVRQRLQTVIAEAQPTAADEPAMVPAAPPPQKAGWLTAVFGGRSTGWAVAAAALVALIWIVSPRLPVGVPRPVPQLDHAQTVRVMPALVAGRVGPEKASAAWEHMHRCRHCFELYQAQWRAARAKPRRTGQSLPHPGAQAPLLVVWESGPRGG